MSLPPLTRRAFGAVSALSAAAVWAPAIGVRAQTDGAALGRVTVAVGGQGVLYHLPLALADAFQCSVNDLPLSLVLCWFEQKAVCILIALLALGIQNIRLGPTLPAFLSPGVVRVLQEKYNLMAVTTPEQDLKAILGEG